MKITTRAELGWGPTAADSARPTRGLVVHFDGSNRGLASKPHSACLAYWQWCREFHTGPSRGWLDVGYSWAACPHGAVLEGRGLGHEQAAQPGGNSTWYSVTFMSGPAEDPTPEQLRAFRELRAWLMARHGLGAAVRGHRDFIATDCPGDRLYALVKDGTLREDTDTVSAPEVWKYEIPFPPGTKENPDWQARNILVDTNVKVRELVAQIGRLSAVVEGQGVIITLMSEALGNLAELDPATLLTEIEHRLEAVKVNLVVDDDQPATT